MLTKLRYQCPDCGRKLAPVPEMRSATQVVKRTCPRCGKGWTLKVTPLASKLPGVRFNVGTFIERKGRS